MQFTLSEEQSLLRDTVRQYVRQELAPEAAALDEKGDFPRKHVDRLAEMGLLGMIVPPEFDGAGCDHLSYAVAVEEVSTGCASTGVIMSVNNSLMCEPLLRFGSETQQKTWLPRLATGEALGCFCLSEPGTGSDAAAQATTAKRTDSGWVVNGTKNWITNGQEASVALVFAMGDRSKGVHGINAYLVAADTPGYAVAKNEKKLGIKASSTSQINFDHVELPDEAMVGDEGDGFKIAMATLDGGRIGIASQAVGIARCAYEGALAYAKERQAFGSPIANLQAIQFMLADMSTQIDAARLLTWRAAQRFDADEPFSLQASMAKLYASEMCGRVTTKALQVYGGFGYSKEYPAERHFRDARITEIYEGTSEIQRLVIARHLLKEGVKALG